MNMLNEMMMWPLHDPLWFPLYHLTAPDIQKKVLVVEDDPMFRLVLSAAVSSIDTDVKVEWVTSADAAKRRLKNGTYNLVIADHFLEGAETGLDLWRDCTTKKTTNGFVLTSSLSDRDVRKMAGSEGKSLSYLKKPLNLATLRDALEHHLR